VNSENAMKLAYELCTTSARQGGLTRGVQALKIRLLCGGAADAAHL
jgi:hypothetical protein